MKTTSIYYMLTAQDMDRAVGFWRDVIGLGVRMESPEWSELTWGDAIVAFHGGATDTELKRSGLGFDVDDIEAACKEVEAAGGRILKPPFGGEAPGLTLADLADTEGNTFMFSKTENR